LPPGTGSLRGERRGPAPDDSIRVEPRTDPAADAALKRRIERQIREGLAGKLRMYEVGVVGREVVIRARPARFWQRRAIRRELEALPALNGTRARVEVID
jgi:hypothetical protein